MIPSEGEQGSVVMKFTQTSSLLVPNLVKSPPKLSFAFTMPQNFPTNPPPSPTTYPPAVVVFRYSSSMCPRLPDDSSKLHSAELSFTRPTCVQRSAQSSANPGKMMGQQEGMGDEILKI